jgi:hypothetical protein
MSLANLVRIAAINAVGKFLAVAERPCRGRGD